MKKIILSLLFFIYIIFFTIACGNGNTTYQEMPNFSKEYFKTISSYGEYRIVYAIDTKVKYLIIENYYKIGITPLFNTDGTLQIYEGNKD